MMINDPLKMHSSKEFNNFTGDKRDREKDFKLFIELITDIEVYDFDYNYNIFNHKFYNKFNSVLYFSNNYRKFFQ